MGNSSHSKVAAPKLPPHPFDPIKKSCFQENVLMSPSQGRDSGLLLQHKVSAKPSTLHHLILRQDWQRVLIRANLYPQELQLQFRVHIYGIDIDVLPLHLICALDPPAAVVAVFLKHFVDATAMPIRPSFMHLQNPTWPHYRKSVFKMPVKIHSRIRRWRENRKGCFPSLDNSAQEDRNDRDELHGDSDLSVEQRRSLLSDGQKPVPGLLGAQSPNYYPSENFVDDCALQHKYCCFQCDDQSSLSSDVPSLPPQGYGCGRIDSNMNAHDDDAMREKSNAILQLSASGGLTEMPISKSHETESTSEVSEKTNPVILHTAAPVVASSKNEDDESSSNTDDTTAMDQPNFIIQLSPSGGVAPMTFNDSKDTASTSVLSEDSDDNDLFRVEWDMKPLLQEIACYGTLLPIHIACIFKASAVVLDQLIQAYPFGTCLEVLGMCPIHLVSAGWNLPCISEPPLETTLAIAFENETPGVAEMLQVLCRLGPDVVDKRSKKHGMTPMEYVEECMKDGDHKDYCMKILSTKGLSCDDNDDCKNPGGIEFDTGIVTEQCHEAPFDFLTLAKSGEDVVDSGTPNHHCFPLEENDNNKFPQHHHHESLVVGLRDLLVNQEWTRALELVEDDPSTAQKWYYGVGDNTHSDSSGTTTAIRMNHPQQKTSSLWKRLPIHLACMYHAPIGLLDLLLRVYPIGAAVQDPQDGSLPLHLLCRARVSLSVVERLFLACPAATQAVDSYGRSALHIAVIYGAPLDVVQYLVQMDPEALVITDQSGLNPLDYAIEGDDTALMELLTLVLRTLAQQTAV